MLRNQKMNFLLILDNHRWLDERNLYCEGADHVTGVLANQVAGAVGVVLQQLVLIIQRTSSQQAWILILVSNTDKPSVSIVLDLLDLDPLIVGRYLAKALVILGEILGEINVDVDGRLSNSILNNLIQLVPAMGTHLLPYNWLKFCKGDTVSTGRYFSYRKKACQFTILYRVGVRIACQ